MSAASRFADLLRVVEERLRRRVAFSSLHPYRIVRQNGQRLNLQAVNERETLLPQLVEVDKAHGLQGVKEDCRSGAIVLVGFQGGSPGAPFVAHYLDAQPLTIDIDADTEVRICGSQALALGAPVEAIAAALSAFANTASTSTTAGQIAAAALTLKSALALISTYSTTKVKGV